MQLGTGSRASFALDEAERERLHARLTLAVRRSRRLGAPALATFSLALPDDADPAALVCASRRAGERWFVFEQPERRRAALAGLGEAVGLQASGAERFTAIAARWRALAAEALADALEDPQGAGPLAFGGFAFAPDGGRAPQCRALSPHR